MLEFKTLYKIISEGKENLMQDSDGNYISDSLNKGVFYFLIYILPVAVSLLPFFTKFSFNDFDDFIISGTSIFTGLFFSLLITIGDKIRKEKENPNKDIENYKAFKTNMKQISKITLMLIFMGILIFLFLLVYKVIDNLKYALAAKIVVSISLILICQYIIVLFLMLQRFFFVIRDELNNI